MNNPRIVITKEDYLDTRLRGVIHTYPFFTTKKKTFQKSGERKIIFAYVFINFFQRPRMARPFF